MSTAYLSFDVETDGPSSSLHSMLSLGITLILPNGTELDAFEVNILEREGAIQDPSTMKFWEENKSAWLACHQNAVSPFDAMTSLATFYTKWHKKYKLVWMAQPACFDWMFVKNYYTMYAPPDAPDIGYKATCMSSIRDNAIRSHIISNEEYTKLYNSVRNDFVHCALADAKHQGEVFVKLL
jgi:hypothetical protein